MKHLLFTVYILLASVTIGMAQEEEQPPYLKYPTLPTFEIVNLDSSGTISTYDIPKDKPILLMFFSPDCDHCIQMTGKMLDHMDVLKKVRIYMITPMSLQLLNTFYKNMNLEKYDNIVAGKDEAFFFPRFYQVSTVPYIAVYDQHKVLVEAFPGQSTIDDILAAVEEAL